MLISVVIPVYNVEPYLAECIESVLAQTYSYYEMICVNDGSTDNSLSILNSYAAKYDRIQVINQENRGLSAARNVGMSAAKGDYIFFLDSDDKIKPETFKILAQKGANEDMICFNGQRIYDDGTKEEPDTGITEDFLNGWEYYNKYALVPRKFNFVCVVLRLYRREFLIANKLFFKEGIYHEDNLFTPIACYFAKNVKVIPDTLYQYRVRVASITYNRNITNLNDLIYVANTLSAFFIPISNIKKNVIYREIALEYFIYFPMKNEVFGLKYKDILQLINLDYFKTVCVYPRHKIMHRLLMFNPVAYKIFIMFEKFVKKILS